MNHKLIGTLALFSALKLALLVGCGDAIRRSMGDYPQLHAIGELVNREPTIRQRFERDFAELQRGIKLLETNTQEYGHSAQELAGKVLEAEQELLQRYREFDAVRQVYGQSEAAAGSPVTLDGVQFSAEQLRRRLTALHQHAKAAEGRVVQLRRMHAEAIMQRDDERNRLDAARQASTVLRHSVDAALIAQDHERVAELLDNLQGLTAGIDGGGVDGLGPSVDYLIRKAPPAEDMREVLSFEVPEHARARPVTTPETRAPRIDPNVGAAAATRPALAAQRTTPEVQSAPARSAGPQPNRQVQQPARQESRSAGRTPTPSTPAELSQRVPRREVTRTPPRRDDWVVHYQTDRRIR